MPSFGWGQMHAPDLGEYYRRQSYYDFLYSLPYYAAGLIMTGVGCGVAPLLLRRVRPSSSGTFVGAAATSLALLLLLALGSDAGTYLGFWRAPSFLLYGGFKLFFVFALCKLFLPASILSGAVELGKRRLDSSAHWAASGLRW
ncbi:MAG: hypothetical protein ACLQGV_04935 [Bryobacteraceae bacterium]